MKLSCISLFLSLLVIIQGKANDGTITTYYMTERDTALIIATRDSDDVITKCFIFGDHTVNEDLLKKSTSDPVIVNPAEFSQLRDECHDVQVKKMPEMVEQGKLAKRKIKAAKGRRHKREAELISSGMEILSGIYPGTLWCGAGNIADAVNTTDGLGDLKGVDACCREHDACPQGVCGWCTGYGLFNSVPWYRSACECDQKFKDCLKADTQNPTEAISIGQLYFDVVDIDCLEFNHPQRCVKYATWLRLFCLEHERDTSKPKVYQWYDQPDY